MAESAAERWERWQADFRKRGEDVPRFAWLIERRGLVDIDFEWYAGKGHWTIFSDEAIPFPTKEDAERYATRNVPGSQWFVAEHGWYGGTETCARCEETLARLEAAANRTAEAEHRAEGWVQHDTEAYAAQSLRALKRAEAAEAERDAALKDVETVGEDMDRYRLLCIKAEAERDAALAALGPYVAYHDQIVQGQVGRIGKCDCWSCVRARAVLGGPDA